MSSFDLSAIDAEIAEPIVLPKSFGRKITKKIVTSMVGASASFAVSRLLHANCPTYNTTEKVKLYIGAYAIGAIVAGKASDYAAELYDDLSQLVEPYLWIPIEPDVPADPQPSDFETLVNAIPDKQ